MKACYAIFTEWNPRTKQYRKLLIPGRCIRVDVYSGYFYQVPELRRCKNWRVRDKYRNGANMTYYVEILEENAA